MSGRHIEYSADRRLANYIQESGLAARLAETRFALLTTVAVQAVCGPEPLFRIFPNQIVLVIAKKILRFAIKIRRGPLPEISVES